MARLYSHFYRVIQDIQGNIVPGVQGTITLADTPTLATLYVDPEGTTTLPNPLFNSTQYGSFSVYLDNGYYDMAFFKEGYVFEPLQDIQIEEASGGVTMLTGTANRVLVSQSVGDIVLNAPQDLHPDASLQFAHLGLGTPANGGLGLLVATGSTFQAPMSTVAINSSSIVTANGFTAPDHPGDTQVAFWSFMNIAGGTNRWAFYAGGDAPAYFGGTLSVAGGTTLSTLTVNSNAGISGSLQVSGAITGGSTLQINGASGFAGGAVGGYAITAYASSQFAANVTVGMLGSAATTTLDVNGSVRSRGAFSGDSTGLFQGYLTCNGGVGIAGGLAVNSGNGYFAGALTVSGATSLAATYINGTLGVGEVVPGPFVAAFNDRIYIRTYVSIATQFTTYNLFCNGSAGTPGGVWVNSTSSAALKQGIRPVESPSVLLRGLRPRQWEWRDDETDLHRQLPGTQTGFVMEEVAEVRPEWAPVAEDGRQGLAMRGLDAVLVAAIQEVLTRLEALEEQA